jgi:F-type H+-transporting ATPase subunit a
MSDHATWFSFLPNYEELVTLARRLNGHVSEDGLSWVGHQPIEIQHVLGLILVVLVILLFALITFGKVKDTEKAIVPEGKFSIRTFVEIFTGYVYDQMSNIMGRKAAKFFLPLIGTCAFVIFFSNFLGLIPLFPVPTSNLNTTLSLALVIFVSTHVFGVKEHGIGYLKHFLGPYLPLAPLMLIIELVSHLARPLSLSIRLMANMTADHMVLAIFISLVPFVVPLPMYALGVIVITVQTLVFCLLSTVYISMAIAHDGH